jgi:hypothetical protein
VDVRAPRFLVLVGFRTVSAPRVLLRGSHQAQALGGGAAVATGLWEFVAVGCGFELDHRMGSEHIVPDGEFFVDSRSADWLLAEFYLLDLQSLKRPAVQLWFADCGFFDRRFFDRGFAGGLATQGHGDVDVFEDAARGDADDAVGGFDEVVAFASAVLAAELVGETESGTELLGLDQEACAVGLPCL